MQTAQQPDFNPEKPPSLIELGAETVRQVMTRAIPCPVCNGRKLIYLGNNTVRDCECVRLQSFWDKFCQTVPEHDQFVTLNTLQPDTTRSRLPVERQTKVLGTLRANPDRSYAFFGPPGTSKTTFHVALYRRALLLRPDATWRVNANSLLQQHHNWVTNREIEGRAARLPEVTAEKILRGSKPALYIQEIDKVVYTPFKTNIMFSLFEAICGRKGQLVFDSNLTFGQFEAAFGPEVGPAISRRVSEMCKVYNFFPKE